MTVDTDKWLLAEGAAAEGEASVVGGRRGTLGTPDFDAFFTAEYPAMVRIAYLMLQSSQLAEDAAQDAFARLLERWGRVENPGGYVRTSVVNRCRDLQRRKKREDNLRLVPRPEQGAHGFDHLFAVLDTLPPRRRAAIVLRYYDGCTEAEIARILGMRAGTVKSTIHRGLRQLREVIER